jgi:hypothetical protein
MNDVEYCMVIIPALPRGSTIENVAVEIFEEWRVGEAFGGKGVLFLIVEETRDLKIEVAYELEPYFTDVFCNSFQESIRNYYAGRFFGDVVSNLILTMAEKYKERNKSNSFENARQHGVLSRQFLSGGGGVRERFAETKDEILRQNKRLAPSNLDRFSPAADPEGSAKRYIESLLAGVNHPLHPVLNLGSRLMELEYPKSADFQTREGRRYRDAGAYRIIVQGDLAVLRFVSEKANPIFLRQTDEGLWLVDQVNSWIHNFRDVESGRSKLQYRDHAWMFAFRDYSYRVGDCRTPRLSGVGEDAVRKIEGALAAIEAAPRDAEGYFELARIFFYECYFLGAAMCENGLELEPYRNEERFLLLDLGYRYPRLDRQEHQYEELLRYDPGSEQGWEAYEWFCRTFLKDEAKAKKVVARAKKALE